MIPYKSAFYSCVPLSGQVVAASGTYTTSALGGASDAVTDGHGQGRIGIFSASMTLSGSGTVKVDVLASNDNTTYVQPITSTSAITGASNGNFFFTLPVPLCRSFQLKLTETGTTNPANITSLIVGAM